MVWTIATPTCDTMVGKILKHYRRTHLQLLSNYQSEATCAMMEHDVMESAIRHIISKPYVTSCNKARIRYDSPWSTVLFWYHRSAKPSWCQSVTRSSLQEPLRVKSVKPSSDASRRVFPKLIGIVGVVSLSGCETRGECFDGSRLTRVCILHRRQDKVKKER